MAAKSQNNRFKIIGETEDSLTTPTIKPTTDKPSQSPIRIKPTPTKEPWLKNKLFAGGGFGLTFGTITNINVSPHIGIRPIEKLWIGAGLNYMYFKDNRFGFTTNVYGPRFFLSYVVWKGIFVHAENEMLNLPDFFHVSEKRIWINSLMGGLGYQQQLGDRVTSYLILAYNFTENRNTPYFNPVFRVGFNVGF